VLARVLAGAVLGIDAYLVTIEADVASGLPAFNVVGLPQGAVKEGRERVVACMQNSGFYVPPKLHHRQPGQGMGDEWRNGRTM
jgi:magnesium chelatase family protein